MDFTGLIIPECAQMRGNCFSSKKLKVLIISTIVISTVMTSVVDAAPLHNKRHMSHLNNACAAGQKNGVVKNRKSWGLKQLQIQMKLIIADFKDVNRTYISENYAVVAGFPKQFTDSKLPKNQWKECETFIEKNNNLTKNQMMTKLYPKFFDGLNTYGIAFRKLYDMKPHTDSAAFVQKKRTDIIQHIIDQHRALVCEVETSFSDSDAKNKGKSKALFNSDIQWPEHPDLTTIHIRDLSVFFEYQVFLTDWQKVLRHVNNIGKNGKTRKRAARKSLEKTRPMKKKKPIT